MLSAVDRSHTVYQTAILLITGRAQSEVTVSALASTHMLLFKHTHPTIWCHWVEPLCVEHVTSFWQNWEQCRAQHEQGSVIYVHRLTFRYILDTLSTIPTFDSISKWFANISHGYCKYRELENVFRICFKVQAIQCVLCNAEWHYSTPPCFWTLSLSK